MLNGLDTEGVIQARIGLLLLLLAPNEGPVYSCKWEDELIRVAFIRIWILSCPV